MSSGKSFFRGPVGVFGGFRYELNPKVALVVERNGDSYIREQRLGSLEKRSDFGGSVEWSPTRFLTASLSFQHGDYVGLTLRTVGDFRVEPKRKLVGARGSADYKTNRFEFDDLKVKSFWYDNFLLDADRSGLRLQQASFAPGSSEVSLTVENMRYEQAGDAIRQALVLGELHLPNSYKQVRVDYKENNLPMGSIYYQRQRSDLQLEGVVLAADQRLSERLQISSPSRALRPSHRTEFNRPRLWLGADLGLRVQVMDPDAPLKSQQYLKTTAALELSDTLNLWSSFSVDIHNNFDGRRTSDSVLPRVRSEINKYLTEGESGVDSIYLEYKSDWTPLLYGRFYGGILEEMFGGLGGEILWSPFAKRWALGANLNWVKKRDYAKDFDFLEYSAITGHFSGYYASPWYNFDFAVHLGGYLAKI